MWLTSVVVSSWEEVLLNKGYVMFGEIQLCEAYQLLQCCLLARFYTGWGAQCIAFNYTCLNDFILDPKRKRYGHWSHSI